MPREKTKQEEKTRVNPEMITLARESRGYTQNELAKRLRVTQGLLSKVESGLKPATPELIGKLAEALDYPERFFTLQDRVYGLGLGTLYHRKRQSLSSTTLAKVHSQINIIRIHLSRLLAAVELPASKIERIDLDEVKSPDQIARIVRARWMLKLGPVQSVTKSIEEAGGIVIRCDFGTPLIDAISQWPPDMPPLFFVNKDIPGDRLRYSLAHEIGHIVMHEEYGDGMENEADRFAAEFLMPASDIAPFLGTISLPQLATLKSYWKVSMAALLKRASDLEKINQGQARYLWMRMSQAGYRKKEPPELDIPVEESTSIRDLLGLHRNRLGYSVAELSDLLVLNEHEFRANYLGQTTQMRVVPIREYLRANVN